MSDCFDDSVLARLFAAPAESMDREAIDAHVAGCDACRRLVGTYARLFAEDASPDEPERSLHGIDLALPSTTVLARAWADAQIGRMLAERWTLRRVIGIGGSAVVFEARHKNESRVAIKVLRPEHLSLAPMMGRFLREAYVANKVDHAGVVRVIDDGVTEEGAPFLVMDLLSGETVRERVERQGTLTETATIELGVAVLEVLERAHARGIVHRDLKPDNIFFDDEQRVRVLDFGIARVAMEEGLTETGLGMGTSAYMPPEQARGEWKAVGPSTDLWALGATLMYALTKRPPHVEDNAQKTLIAAATTPAPKTSVVMPSVTAALAAAIDQALAFEQEKRPTDATAMREALLRAGPELSTAVEGHETEDASSPSTRSSGWRTVALVALLMPIATALYVTFRAAPDRESTTASTVTESPSTTPVMTTSTVVPEPTSPGSSTLAQPPPSVPRAAVFRPNVASSASPSASQSALAPAASSVAPASSAPMLVPTASASATPGDMLRRRH